MKPTWEKPKTSRIYLHTPHSDKILMLQPDFKVTALNLDFVQRHTRQDACGVHLLTGKAEPDALDYRTTVWDAPTGGRPIYTVRNTDPENGCAVSMTALAEPDACIYVRVTVRNDTNAAVDGSVGLLPRSVKNNDHYLTGLWDTGYESYLPNWKQWLLQRADRMSAVTPDTARADSGTGTLKILSSDGFSSCRWISREEQPKRFSAQDYFACDYTLPAGKEIRLDFAFMPHVGQNQTKSFDDAYTEMCAYWDAIQARVTLLPKTDAPRILDLYRQNVTQCLQMIQTYTDKGQPTGPIARQGDVGRYIWIWEAAHLLIPLDRLGFSDYTTDVYKTFCSWLCMEGENAGTLTYRFVVWDNMESALIWGISEHLRYVNDPEQFTYFRPYLIAMLRHINMKRSSVTKSPYPGLYPMGKASDWGEIGQHWTFTDAVQVHGIESYVKACEQYGSSDLEYVRSSYEDYRSAVVNVMNRLYAGHENDASFMLPHIAGLSFEESYNHCYYTDGAPYLCMLGIMDPKSRMFEQMEAFYNENGLFDHGLCGRLTNATDFGVGAYGDCYYTGVAELIWLYPWMVRGEWGKADRTTAALLNYNVTTEYVVSERYCSFDPWYTPWQPNGSGSGRIVMYLLDYFDNRAKAFGEDK